MMDCDKAREAISSSMDGEPLGVDGAGLGAHLKTCDSCREYARQVAVLDKRLREMPTVGIGMTQSSSRWAQVSLALDDHDRKQLESVGSKPSPVARADAGSYLSVCPRLR
ncbi:MAG: zf-HC2 domain-containing protein [Burkholderiaceae bacterium]